MKSRKKITVGLTGHGSGGHFYPLIAVAESINKTLDESDIQILYFGPNSYDETSLDTVKAKLITVPAGKRRNYRSYKNFTDLFKIAWGTIVAFIKLTFYYPDVLFSKGGYAAFPVLVAARILRIPIVIHDSDIIPGRVSQISEKWARRVAVAWPEAIPHYTNAHTALVGNPIRQTLIDSSQVGGRELLHIPHEAVVLLILGGSQGAEIINTTVLDGLTELLENFYVIHQVGENNLKAMELSAETLLSTELKEKYQIFGTLNEQAMARSLGAADVVITRAGASGLFETAIVGQVPAFVIPITSSVNNHQLRNAYAYQKAGAGIVIEEANLKPDILVRDIKELIKDPVKYQAMKQAAKQFSNPDAADKIANELIQIANEH